MRIPPPYTVDVNGNYPPYSYYDLAGNLIGFDVDLMEKIAADQGFTVMFKQIDWPQTIPSLLSHEIDMYISHLVITPEREKLVAFSQPYGMVNQAIAVKGGTNFTYQQFSRGDLRVGVQADTINADWVRATISRERYDRMVADGRITLYDTFPQSMIAQDIGLVDCAVFDEGDVMYYIQNAKYESNADFAVLAVAKTNNKYGIAVRKDGSDLRARINAGLDHVMSSDQIWGELTRKYQLTVL